MKKKILYLILFRDFNAKKAEGIKKKILLQVKAMENLGCEVDLIYILKDGIYLNNVKKINFRNFKISYYLLLFKNLEKILKGKTYNLIYTRRFIHFNYMGFFKFLKNFNAKKIVEVPTYPFEGEAKNFKLKIAKFLEKYYFKKNQLRIDFVTYFGEPTEKIWNIQAIELQNGINVEEIKINIKNQNNEEIRFIGVAGLYDWHGYDRLIKSIYNCQNKNIKFDIVGEGEPTLTNLKKLVKILKLEEQVKFHGYKAGEELDEIYKNASIGVDSLARHRSGNVYNSSLKSKEYIARGLPIIKSHHDKMLDNKEFVYEIESNNSEFNLEKILIWLETNKFSSIEIHNYALENMSWEKQMKKVINLI